MNKLVVAIALDATDPVQIERWMAQGWLPNLSKLREKGAYGRLRTQVDLFRRDFRTVSDKLYLSKTEALLMAI